MKCVSLFSGAGGLDLGLEAAGFEIVSSIEQDADCCRTLEKNGRAGVIKTSVAEVDFSSIAQPEEIDLLVGGPPCQPFSKSALWTHGGTRGLEDPRSSTIGLFFSALASLRPKAFLLENVAGFAKWGGLSAVQEALAILAKDGLHYHLSQQVLNAAEYGVPQKRMRFFAVGVRSGTGFDFPTPSHGPGRRSPFATAWDACSSAPTDTYDERLAVRGRWSELLPSIPPGKNYLHHTPRGTGEPLFGWRTRFWSFLYKLDPHQPSPTIVASPSQNSGPFHWNNRLLSTEELSAIQTFPPEYAFYGDRASRQRQIGNAVPPLLAEAVGRALKFRLGGESKPELRFSLGQATSLPALPAIQPVPTKYRQHIGKHPDHPGSGLGPRARARPTPPLEETA